MLPIAVQSLSDIGKHQLDELIAPNAEVRTKGISSLSNTTLVPEDIHDSIQDSLPVIPITSQLASTPLLEKLGFQYNTIAMVLICINCQHCVPPRDAVAHAKQNHFPNGIPNAPGTLSSLQSDIEVEALDLELELDIPQPLGHGSSILDGLVVNTDTVQCITCGYVGLPSTVNTHQKQNHCGMHLPANQRTMQCTSQHFTTKSPYWRVSPGLSRQQDRVISLEAFEPYLEKEDGTILPFSGSHTRDRPPLLLFTGWDDWMEKWYATSKGRKQVATLCEVPKAADPLHFISELALAYLGKIGKQARSMDHARLRIFQNYPV
jgi:Orsellinic acid/F9775 biosynthesis cluster protein D